MAGSISLADLLTARTAAQVKALLIARLQGRGFPTTDWGTFAPERVMLEMFTQVLTDLTSELVPLLAKSGLIELAEGDWLTLVARDMYQLDREQATRTRQTILLTAAPSAGPYTIAVDALEVRSTTTLNRYRNVEGGTLTLGGTLSLSFEAVEAGADYSDDAGSITEFLTPLPGVTVENVAPDFGDVTHLGSGAGTVAPSGTNVTAANWKVKITFAGGRGTGKYRLSDDNGATYGSEITITAGTGINGPDGDNLVLTFSNDTFVVDDTYSFATPGSPITVQGTDQEDDDTLRSRCRARWPLLSAVPTIAVYELWARLASDQVTRVKVVTSSSINDRIDIYVIGALLLGDDVVSEVQTYLDARKGTSDLPVVDHATAIAITITGTATVEEAFLASAQAEAQELVQAYIDSIEIGGVVRLAQIIELIMTPEGMVDFVDAELMGVATNVTLTALQAATWAEDIAAVLTWETV